MAIHVLRPDIKLTIGHCIQLIKELPDESVDVFYLDPPFDSDRIYTLSSNSEVGFKDKWSGDEYKKFITEVTDACYTKLAKTGTLFFHISSDCMFIPETILRQKFKYVTPIFWKKCRSKNNVKNKLGTTIDIIFKCNKVAKPVFNVVYQSKDEKYLQNSFKNEDERGNYALGHVVTEPTKKGHKYSFTIDGRKFEPESGWRVSMEDLQTLADENRLHIPKGQKANLYKKIYLSENPGKCCTDLWDDIHSIGQGSEERKYPTAKPQKLLERIISIASNEGDTICDPMCGSGTTGAAAEALGRKCILFDCNTDIVSIVKTRFP
jgi:DNA modification methylase